MDKITKLYSPTAATETQGKPVSVALTLPQSWAARAVPRCSLPAPRIPLEWRHSSPASNHTASLEQRHEGVILSTRGARTRVHTVIHIIHTPNQIFLEPNTVHQKTTTDMQLSSSATIANAIFNLSLTSLFFSGNNSRLSQGPYMSFKEPLWIAGARLFYRPNDLPVTNQHIHSVLTVIFQVILG